MRTIDKSLPPFYLIISDVDTEPKYSPIVLDHDEKEYVSIGTVPHLLDRKLIKTFKAIWISLHFPRSFADFSSISAVAFRKMQSLWLGQRVVHIFPGLIQQNLENTGYRFYSVVFYEDNLKEEVLKYKELNPETAFVSFSEIDSSLVNEIWERVAKSYGASPETPYRKRVFPNLDELFGSKLASYFVFSHLGHEGNPVWTEFDLEDVLNVHQFLRSAELAEKKNSHELEKFKEESFNSFKIPVSLIAPGVSRKHVQNIKVKDERFVAENFSIWDIDKMTPFEIENLCLNLIATHEAVAHNGAVVSLDMLPYELFQLIDQIENHCLQARSESGAFIWKKLDEIGVKVTSLLSNDEATLILRGSIVNAYTKFPIGLSVLNGYSSPLAFIVPIVYKPILPLTRTYQLQFGTYRETIFLDNNCNILFAEMFEEDDMVGKLCYSASKFVEDRFEKNSRVNVQVMKFQSIQSLNEYLKENSIDFLVIGAHGTYDRRRNYAGIVVDGKPSIGEELEHVPKFVMLRSCSTAPMGVSPVTITDILLRNGASVVIAPSIPVDVNKNAHLLVRFLNYMFSEDREVANIKTFLDAWFHSISTNAIMDICMTNEKLYKDLFSERIGNTPLIQYFMTNSHKFKITKNNAYKETLEALISLTEGRPVKKKLEKLRDNNEVIPESAFYKIFGWPERVFLGGMADL